MNDQQQLEIALATPTECELIRQIASSQPLSKKQAVWVTDRPIFQGIVFQPE